MGRYRASCATRLQQQSLVRNLLPPSAAARANCCASAPFIPRLPCGAPPAAPSCLPRSKSHARRLCTTAGRSLLLPAASHTDMRMCHKRTASLRERCDSCTSGESSGVVGWAVRWDIWWAARRGKERQRHCRHRQTRSRSARGRHRRHAQAASGDLCPSPAQARAPDAAGGDHRRSQQVPYTHTHTHTRAFVCVCL